jgi:hypothetical protein
LVVRACAAATGSGDGKKRQRLAVAATIFFSILGVGG